MRVRGQHSPLRLLCITMILRVRRYKYRNEQSWKLGTKKSYEIMASEWSKRKTTPEILRMGENNCTIGNNLRGKHQASSTNLQENGQDLGKALLRSWNVEMTTRKTLKNLMKHFERIKSGKIEPNIKEFGSYLGEGIWQMKFILTSNFEKNIRIMPGKL